MGSARQGVPASVPYIDVHGGKRGGSATALCAGEASDKVPACTPFAIYSTSTKHSEPSQWVPKQGVAIKNVVAIYQGLVLLEQELTFLSFFSFFLTPCAVVFSSQRPFYRCRTRSIRRSHRESLDSQYTYAT